METITSWITQKLKLIDESKKSELAKIINDLDAEGMSAWEIERAIRNHLDLKSRQFYRKAKDPTLLKDSLLMVINKKPDSKAEVAFYNYLEDKGLKFTFQHEIGPYRVDFLVKDQLVVEVDGPHHKNQIDYDKKRDKYLKDMGYDVLRIPIRMLKQAPEEVVEMIREYLILTDT